MKIACYCGAWIADQTDRLPYKAHVVPDADLFWLYGRSDGLELPDGTPVLSVDDFDRASDRTVYQCATCGRLYFTADEPRKLYCFVPADESVPKNILRGRAGEA